MWYKTEITHPDGTKEIFNNINGGQEIYIIEGQGKLAAQ